MFKIKDEAERATVYIYGTIGDDWSEEDSNRAKDFAQKLDSLAPKPIDLRIDSCGGDVYEGFAIASAIMRYPGVTHAFVDGVAASAASYVALAADAVTMYSFSMLMIHNAWAVMAGNADELREQADKLDAIDGTIAALIAARSGLDAAEVRQAMAAETWYTAEDAVAAGMADDVIETQRRVAACIDRAMAARFKRIPQSVHLIDDAPSRGDAAAAGDGDGSAHAASNIGEDEPGAGGAVLVGNRIYRKENGNEHQ